MMPVLPRIIGRFLPILIDQLHVGSEFNIQLDYFHVPCAGSIEETGLPVPVLVVDIAACPKQGVTDPGASVVLGRVEERRLVEEVIVVERKVEG